MAGHPQASTKPLGSLLHWLPLILLCFSLSGCSQQPPKQATPRKVPKEAATPVSIDLGNVFALTTQWYPCNAHNEEETESPLLRELVRQSVLIAAREELGLVTRDETLGEFQSDDASLSEEDQAALLTLAFELDETGTWNARLYGAGSTRANPVWKHQGKIAFNKRTLYSQIAAQCTQLVPTISEKIQTAGNFEIAKDINTENIPTTEIEERLAEMNFVSQFSAIRTAHLAIQSAGASPQWYGVLVRGYAHLALLTDHTWCSQSDAFAARSLLYAERMLQLGIDDDVAKLHRAYALSIVGLHSLALEQLFAITTLVELSSTEEYAWTQLLEPFAMFDHDSLSQIGKEIPQLLETAHYLQWRLYHCYMHGRWIYEKGIETFTNCPEAYGVYSALAGWNSLRTQRVGARTGAAAFARLLPTRVQHIPDLPANVSRICRPPIGILSRLRGLVQNESFSDLPIRIARELTSANDLEEKPTECSWTILAQLISEEQFIEVANICDVSGNAVEHSQNDLVDRLLPLVEGHRYAPYISSFRFTPAEKSQKEQITCRLRIVDPRGSMNDLYTCVWHTPLPYGKNGNALAWRSIWGRNFTLPGIMSVNYGIASNWTEAVKPQHYQTFARELAEVSPHACSSIRLQWETASSVSDEQLETYKTKIQDDPVGWITLGNLYYDRGKIDSAILCYQRSLDISPSYSATEKLAYCYYYTDKKERWLSTLESYLEFEDLGLAHAKIHQRIANEHISNRAWSKAEPHALAAAHTYSSWGLELAAKTYEGMQDLESAEDFYSKVTTSYPSYSSGTAWFFFCQRTGYGDLEAAQNYAERSVDIALQGTYSDSILRAFIYHVLEGDYQEALQVYDQQVKTCSDVSEDVWDQAYILLFKVSVAAKLDDPTKLEKYTAELKTLVDDKIAERYPNWKVLYEGICSGFAGNPISEEFLKSFDESLVVTDQSFKTNYSYFLGAALDHLGQVEQADKYLRYAAFAQPFDRYNATLAGALLVKRHGPDRGGMPQVFVDLEAEATATESVADENNSEESGESSQEESGETEPESDSSEQVEQESVEEQASA